MFYIHSGSKLVLWTGMQPWQSEYMTITTLCLCKQRLWPLHKLFLQEKKFLGHLPLLHYPAASSTSQDAAGDTFKLQGNGIGIINMISNSPNSTL